MEFEYRWMGKTAHQIRSRNAYRLGLWKPVPESGKADVDSSALPTMAFTDMSISGPGTPSAATSICMASAHFTRLNV